MIKLVCGHADSSVGLSNLTSQCIYCPSKGNQRDRVTMPGRTQWQIRFEKSSKEEGILLAISMLILV